MRIDEKISRVTILSLSTKLDEGDSGNQHGKEMIRSQIDWKLMNEKKAKETKRNQIKSCGFHCLPGVDYNNFDIKLICQHF